MRTLEGPQSGKRGNIVASRNRAGQFLRQRIKPGNPRTPAQRRARQRMGEASRRWSRLTEEQRRAWWAVAANVRSRTRLGQSGPLDGQKLFVKINTVLAICGREPLTDPPSPPIFAPNPVAAFTITRADGRVVLQFGVSAPPAADIMVFASPPCNAGRSYCSNFSFLGLLPAPIAGLSDISRLYFKKYGVPRPGSRIFIRAVQQVNGWEDRRHTLTTNALVPPRWPLSPRK